MIFSTLKVVLEYGSFEYVKKLKNESGVSSDKKTFKIKNTKKTLSCTTYKCF